MSKKPKFETSQYGEKLEVRGDRKYLITEESPIRAHLNAKAEELLSDHESLQDIHKERIAFKHLQQDAGSPVPREKRPH